VTAPARDVAIIGAGPYGLAAAMHLRAAGAAVHLLGEPMSFWERHMPKGMRLRSPWGASSLADPGHALTLDRFERARGSRLRRPVPLEDFVAYGRWFQQSAALEIDVRRALAVDRDASGFRVRLEDGDQVACRRLVVAAGIRDFAYRPPEFEAVPSELASHSGDHADLTPLAGRRVAVIGGGQSALESAALLHECGADVELIVRRPGLHWVGRATRDGLLGRILFDRTDVGPAVLSHVVARPAVVRRLPVALRQRLTRRSTVAGGAGWLRKRLGSVRTTTGRRILSAERSNGRLRLRLDDGGTRELDHVILATGYRVDVSRYSFLTPALLAGVRQVRGQPILDDGLQSSVDGLHFLGAPATYSFGPLVRFVCGSDFSARALTRGITRNPSGAMVYGLGDRALDLRSTERRAK
jgi:cation diffusion facilitator CzcD-associated flavoprotein CzcO